MKWEYRTLKFESNDFTGSKFNQTELDAALNELGQEGWELFKALDTMIYTGTTQAMVFVFKRPAD